MKHSYEPVGHAKPVSDSPATSPTSPGSCGRVESTGCAAQRSTRGISSRARRLPDDFPMHDFPVGDRGEREVAASERNRAFFRRNTPAVKRAKTAFIRDAGRNATGFLGVRKHRQRDCFEAYIRDTTKGGRKVYCGCGKTAEDAARAYDRKARELYGPSAVVNFPPGAQR